MVTAVRVAPDWVGDWDCTRCGGEIKKGMPRFQRDEKIPGAKGYWYCCLNCARELGLLW